jgi:hypothetical protein
MGTSKTPTYHKYLPRSEIIQICYHWIQNNENRNIEMNAVTEVNAFYQRLCKQSGEGNHGNHTTTM